MDDNKFELAKESWLRNLDSKLVFLGWLAVDGILLEKIYDLTPKNDLVLDPDLFFWIIFIRIVYLVFNIYISINYARQHNHSKLLWIGYLDKFKALPDNIKDNLKGLGWHANLFLLSSVGAISIPMFFKCSLNKLNSNCSFFILWAIVGIIWFIVLKLLGEHGLDKAKNKMDLSKNLTSKKC